MEQKNIDELIKDLEQDIYHYCGDYGTLESQVEDTFYKILLILKQMKGNFKMNNEELKELIETYKNERDTYKRLAECYINKYNKERSYNNE